MLRMTNPPHSRFPFRAEHIGSLVRPQKLVDARRAFLRMPVGEKRAHLVGLGQGAGEVKLRAAQKHGIRAGRADLDAHLGQALFDEAVQRGGRRAGFRLEGVDQGTRRASHP